jgi:DNA-binding transcriptional regulator YhcF (GntR family)
MLDANKKREMTEKIVKDIIQRMKDQGMSQDDILKTIEKLSKQANED